MTAALLVGPSYDDQATGTAREHAASISKLLMEAAQRSRDFLSDRGQALKLSIHSRKEFPATNAAWIAEIFDVLVAKASLFACPGGHIWLRARVIDGFEADPCECRCYTRMFPETLSGPHLVVTIRDDGPGTLRAPLPRVVDLLALDYRRTHQTALGMRLRQMQFRAELMGGRLCATSSGVGLGTEFDLRLPVPHGVS